MRVDQTPQTQEEKLQYIVGVLKNFVDESTIELGKTGITVRDCLEPADVRKMKERWNLDFEVTWFTEGATIHLTENDVV